MSEKAECVWVTGTPHRGEVKVVQFFDGQVTIPVCEWHVIEYQTIMDLHGHPDNKFVIEDILKLSHKQRLAVLDKLSKETE